MQEILLGPMKIEILLRRKQMLLDAGKSSPYVFPGEKSACGHLVDPGNAWETFRENSD